MPKKIFENDVASASDRISELLSGLNNFTYDDKSKTLRRIAEIHEHASNLQTIFVDYWEDLEEIS